MNINGDFNITGDAVVDGSITFGSETRSAWPSSGGYVVSAAADQDDVSSTNGVAYLINAIGTNEATLCFYNTLGEAYTNYTFDSATTTKIPSNITLRFEQGARLNVTSSSAIIQIAGTIDAGRYQIFNLTSGAKIRTKRLAGAGGAQSFVYPEWWGAVGDAVAQKSGAAASGTNDRVALQSAIDFFSPGPDSTTQYDIGNTDVIGGVVKLGATKRYLIQGGNLDINCGVIIEGSLIATSGTMLFVRRFGSSLVLDTDLGNYSILVRHNAGLRNVCVINHALEYIGYAYTAHPVWYGTGISVDEGSGSTYYGNTSLAVRESVIVGFEYGIKAHEHSGCVVLTNLFMDNLNGIYVYQSGNMTEITNVQMFKFATYTSPEYGGEDVGGSRTGNGIKVGYSDWGAVTNCFVRGYQRGYVMSTNANHYAFTGCHYEGSLEDTTLTGMVAFQIGGDFGSSTIAADATFVNCHAGTGNVGNSCGWLINNTTSTKSTGKVAIVGCTAYGCKYGVYVGSGVTYNPEIVGYYGYLNTKDVHIKAGTEYGDTTTHGWSFIDYLYTDHTPGTF